jgi:hypothetical protein
MFSRLSRSSCHSSQEKRVPLGLPQRESEMGKKKTKNSYHFLKAGGKLNGISENKFFQI